MTKIKQTTICIYRPSGGEFDILLTNLDLALHKIFDMGFSNLITTDYKIDFLKNTTGKEKLLDVINSYSLRSVFLLPFRVTASTLSCIDNVLSDLDEYDLYTIKSRIADHLAHTCIRRETAENFKHNVE